MPAELLLPLFAVVLAVNALFVGLAIRSLWRSRDGEPRTSTWTSLPVLEDVIARSVRERGTAPGPRPVAAEGDLATDDDDRPDERAPADAPEPEPDAVAGPETGGPTGLETGSSIGPETGSPPEPEPEPAATATATATTEAATEARPERGPAPRPALDTAATAAPTRTPRRRSAAAASTPPGGRRRFALPPLDDDHEKVRRSIETFLGGDIPTPDVPPDPASILTVAVIGLAGLDARSDPAPPRRPRVAHAAEGSGPAELRAMLERTVRSTARGTDVVSIDRHGRVRVILPGTGELAAHAYLRRIRAIVEPIAEAATPPTRVVVATATVLDGSVASARRRADRRFAAALQGRAGAPAAESPAIGASADPAPVPDETIAKPRASGD